MDVRPSRGLVGLRRAGLRRVGLRRVALLVAALLAVAAGGRVAVWAAVPMRAVDVVAAARDRRRRDRLQGARRDRDGWRSLRDPRSARPRAAARLARRALVGVGPTARRLRARTGLRRAI